MMARASPAFIERAILLIGFVLLLWQLNRIRSELRPIEIITETIIESPGVEVVCKEKAKPFPKANYFLSSRYHAVVAGGGLGNQLFELISVIGLASQLGRTPLIQATDTVLIKELVNGILEKYPLILEQFTVKLVELAPFYAIPFNERDCCRAGNLSILEQYSENQFLDLDGYYFQSFKYFHHLHPSVRRWLTPLPNHIKKASRHLPDCNKKDIIICTHIRRGDFTDDGMHRPSDPNFTRKATHALAEKYSKGRQNVTVVVLGNDPLWAQSIFRDKVTVIEGFSIPRKRNKDSSYSLVITPTLDPEVDLAFSGKYCDVVLITGPSSTFGWWLGYLAKPRAVVYYRDIKDTEDGVLDEMNPDDFYPPEWIKLSI